jgi:hypothetical protein
MRFSQGRALGRKSAMSSLSRSAAAIIAKCTAMAMKPNGGAMQELMQTKTARML